MHSLPPSMTEAALARLPVASPEQLARRALLERVDTKYLIARDHLPALLAALVPGFAVLPAGGRAIATYRNLYLDTPELVCFHDHRRGRRIRCKVRIRHYPERRVSFLEVKRRRHARLTDKLRRALAFEQEAIGPDERAFVAAHAPALGELAPILRVDYRRIALLHQAAIERVSIDLDVVAHHGDARAEFGAWAIVEVKRGRAAERPSPEVARALAGVRATSLSKYCVALALLRPEVRHNLLRPILRRLRGKP